MQGKEYEVDEMRTYIGNKGRLYWVVYALRRDTKEVIDFKVGKRNLKTLCKVVDTVLLSEAKKVHTDGYELYKSIVPEELHHKAKYNINHIRAEELEHKNAFEKVVAEDHLLQQEQRNAGGMFENLFLVERRKFNFDKWLR